MAKAALIRWLTFSAVLGVTACGISSSRSGAMGGLETSVSQIRIRNLGWADVRVFAVREGMQHSLGTVTLMNDRTFLLPSDMIGTRGLRLRIIPIGTMRMYITDRVLVTPGQRVHLTVHDPLEFSNLVVRPGTGPINAGMRRER